MAQRTPEKPTLGGFFREATTEFSGFERGVPYTVKCLLSSPGATVRRYLDERDPHTTRPLRLLAMGLALYFLAARPGGVDELNLKHWRQILGSDGSGESTFREFLTRYQAALFALVLPLMLLATRVAWSRSGRTLAEHLTLNTHRFSARLLIIIPIVLLGLAQGSAAFDRIFMVLHDLVNPLLPFGFAAWMMATFFSGSRISSAIRAVAILLGMLLPRGLIVPAILRPWTRLTGASAG